RQRGAIPRRRPRPQGTARRLLVRSARAPAGEECRLSRVPTELPCLCRALAVHPVAARTHLGARRQRGHLDPTSGPHGGLLRPTDGVLSDRPRLADAMTTVARAPEALAPGRVCAVVVTRDRRELLRRCLTALRQEDRPPDAVLVVDNASSDGSAGLVE